MINKNVAPLKLELLSSYEMEITKAAPAINPPSEEAPPSPFLDSGYAHGYFPTPTLDERLAGLLHDVYAGDKIQRVEGEQGIGKTAFLREFLRRCDPSWEVCHIQARIALGEKHILARIAQAFFPSEELDLHALVERLVERGRNGPFTLLVVDDAQNLSVFAVKILLDLKRALTMAGGRLGVVLAATSRLETLIGASSLRRYAEEWIDTIPLPPFTEQETADYLRHRIALAGAGISFDEAQVRLIHRCAGGAPKYINRVARDLLAGRKPRAYADHRRREGRPVRRRSLAGTAAAAGVLLAAVFAAYLVWFKPAPPGPAGPPMTGSELAELKNIVVPAQTQGGEPAGPAPAAVAPERPAPPPPAPVKSAAPAVPAGRQDRPPAPAAPTRDQAAAKKSTAAAGGGHPSAPPQTAAAAAGGQAPVKPQVDTPPPAPREPEAAPVGTRAPPPAGGQEGPADAEPGAPGSADLPDDPAPDLRGNAWLLALAPDHYTIQLVGFPQADMAGEFIRSHGLIEDAAVVQTVRGDRDWYLVLYKDFASLTEARSALAELPGDLRRNDPWVREVSAVSAVTVRR